MDLPKLYKKQISFTEWFEQINHSKTEEMRIEDNSKRERLETLNSFIGIPFDKATTFAATELVEKTERFNRFLTERGEELCALRLVPLASGVPKLRMRGDKIKDIMRWFAEQKIDPSKYRADFVPHSNKTIWSTTFIVNRHGIFGEIIRGGHHKLTQGFYEEDKPLFFSYDFSEWNVTDQDALNHLKGIVKRLKIVEHQTQNLITQELNSYFSNNYLCGYFETVFSLEFGLWFIDYNRVLGKMYQDFSLVKGSKEGDLQGISANNGKVSGKIRIVKELENYVFNEGEILVCGMTTPEHLPLMKKAKAIITDLGGVLTHAAIVSRELGIPCITGVNMATSVLKDGDEVEVDANKGVIRKL